MQSTIDLEICTKDYDSTWSEINTCMYVHSLMVDYVVVVTVCVIWDSFCYVRQTVEFAQSTNCTCREKLVRNKQSRPKINKSAVNFNYSIIKHDFLTKIYNTYSKFLMH